MSATKCDRPQDFESQLWNLPALPALLRGLPRESDHRERIFGSEAITMTILITGATGFLGSALVTALVKQKQAVRILARDEQKARAQFGEAITIIRGEITDVEQVKQAVDGATIIYPLVCRRLLEKKKKLT